jgi:hypothetical protein
VLPLVCKRFHTLCKADFFWRDAMERLIQKQPTIWIDGLIDFIVRQEYSLISSCSADSVISDMEDFEGKTIVLQEKMQSTFRNRDHASMQALLNRAYDYAIKGAQQLTQGCENVYELIFKSVLNYHVRLTLPIFMMRDPSVSIDSSVGLHLFEPRYRLMMSEVMLPYPRDRCFGVPCNFLRKPRFVYAFRGSISQGSQVAIVEVEQCFTYPDYRADIVLTIKELARIEKSWVRPNSYGLYEARVLRTGS